MHRFPYISESLVKSPLVIQYVKIADNKEHDEHTCLSLPNHLPLAYYVTLLKWVMLHNIKNKGPR